MDFIRVLKATCASALIIVGSHVITPLATAQTSSLPAPWASQDVGSPALTGSVSVSSGIFTIRAGGSDIWGTSDQFHFVYQRLTGDGEIVARVGSVTAADVWSKAGVMMRETLAANSKHAYALGSASRGVGFQRRVTTGGNTAHT